LPRERATRVGLRQAKEKAQSTKQLVNLVAYYVFGGYFGFDSRNNELDFQAGRCATSLFVLIRRPTHSNMCEAMLLEAE
jgi:hypothetical protein